MSATLDTLLGLDASSGPAEQPAVDVSSAGFQRLAAHAIVTDRSTRPPAITARRKIDVSDAVLFLFAADVLGGILAACGVFRLYATPRAYGTWQLWAGIAGFVAAWAFSASRQRLYAREALLGRLGRLSLTVLTVSAMTFGMLVFAGFGLDLIGGVSRVWVVGWAGAVVAGALAARIVVRAVLRERLRGGGCVERVLMLAGSVQSARRLGRTMQWESGEHIGVVAAAALPGMVGAPSLDWVEDAVRSGQVDRVVVGDAIGLMGPVNAVLARLTRLAVHVTVLPDLEELQAPILKVDRIGMLPVIDLDYHPLSPFKAGTKRAEDLVLGAILTLAVLPVLVAVAVAIKLDSPGPVLFRQKRAGFNDRVFSVLKFRTMHHHSRDELSLRQTTRGDPRVTRVGRLLRRTSLDELPQLFNVLCGDMSIVGPRPHALGMTAVGLPLREVIEEYSARHRLKPGITGWAQVNGSRGEVDTHDKLRRRVALDCHYIENWSLSLDLSIIVRTAAMLFGSSHAY